MADYDSVSKLYIINYDSEEDHCQITVDYILGDLCMKLLLIEVFSYFVLFS